MRRALLLTVAVSSACTPARNDATDAGFVDAGADFDFCNELSIEECDVVGCERAYGVLEDDFCGERGADVVALTCMPSPGTCGESIECAVRPEDGARFAFFSACPPPRWQRCALCDELEYCETVESAFDVCVDEAASCDAFIATWNERFQNVVDATNVCASDLDCTTELVSFLCGTGEVFVQGCAIPIAHDFACEYRQAVQDLEAELCTDGCVPDDCALLASCPFPAPVACVRGHCAFAP